MSATVTQSSSPFVSGAGGNSAKLNGTGSAATGIGSTAEGINNTASGTGSHAEGSLTTSGPGTNTHSEGSNTNATANNAHAEGNGTIASGTEAHAQGLSTTASGNQSHAEGVSCQANGTASHAGGTGAITTGALAFNHSSNAGGATDAAGTASAILGGTANNINAAAAHSFIAGGSTNTMGALALRSVILGGNTQTLNEPDTAQSQELRITKAFKIASGNTPSGTVTLVGGTVVVSNTSVKTGAKIMVSHESFSGVVGNLSAPKASIVNNTSFVITSDNPLDTSNVNYFIVNI